MGSNPTGLPQTPRFGPGNQYPQNPDEWAIFIRWLLENFRTVSSNSSLGLALGLGLGPGESKQNALINDNLPPLTVGPQPQPVADPSNQILPLLSRPPGAPPRDDVDDIVAYLLTKPPYPVHPTGQVLYGTRAQRQATVGSSFPLGTIWSETDTNLIYVVDVDPIGGPNNWWYQSGIWQIYWPNRRAPFSIGNYGLNDWTYLDWNVQLLVVDQAVSSVFDTSSGNGALFYTVQYTGTGSGVSSVFQAFYQMGTWLNASGNRPSTIPSVPSSGLFVEDKGFTTFCANVGHQWSWDDVHNWYWSEGEAAGYCVMAPVAPNPGTGWWQQIPTGGASYTISDSSGGIGTNFNYPAYTSLATLNSGWFLFARL